MRSLPDPLHVAPLVVLQVGAFADTVGQAMVFGGIPVLRHTFLTQSGALQWHLAAVVADQLELMHTVGGVGASVIEHREEVEQFALVGDSQLKLDVLPDKLVGIHIHHALCTVLEEAGQPFIACSETLGGHAPG
ncbi:hypothetical protein D3C84_835970 [compost metagenome]